MILYLHKSCNFNIIIIGLLIRFLKKEFPLVHNNRIWCGVVCTYCSFCTTASTRRFRFLPRTSFRSSPQVIFCPLLRQGIFFVQSEKNRSFEMSLKTKTVKFYLTGSGTYTGCLVKPIIDLIIQLHHYFYNKNSLMWTRRDSNSVGSSYRFDLANLPGPHSPYNTRRC